MYPSLSIIDDAEVRRQVLLSDAALKHGWEAHRLLRSAPPMATLVNASYGLAMGQRPTAAENVVGTHASRLDDRPPEQPARNDPAGAGRARCLLRAVAAAIASVVRPRVSPGASSR